MDQIFILVYLLFLITVALAVIVLPIVSLILSLRSRKRISQIQARIDRIEKTLAAHSIFPTAARPEPEARPAPGPEPVLPPLPPVTPEPLPPVPAFSAYRLESIIGRRWIGWVAVLLILFATAFFLKYAFDNRWIGELGRVAIGIAFGIAMCLGGFKYQRQGWRIFAQILTGGRNYPALSFKLCRLQLLPPCRPEDCIYLPRHSDR